MQQSEISEREIFIRILFDIIRYLAIGLLD